METDLATRRHVRLLAALLDHDTPPWQPGQLPPLGHWLMFAPETLQSKLGADGHPLRDNDGLPRRMWAGSRLRYFAPVPLDSIVQRQTTIRGQAEKIGRSGRMRFVTLVHRLTIDGALVAEEEQDIVYRAAHVIGTSSRPEAPDQLTPIPLLTRRLRLEPTALFRFSALTFNAHRIHYDRHFAIETEGYRGLVVHGPFIAILLIDLYLRHYPATFVRGFSFRALRPIFDGEPVTLGLTPDDGGGDLIAIDAAGGIAAQARIDI